jgi:hypothetical protein
MHIEENGADIDSVNYFNDKVEVRGYQNFDITKDDISVLDNKRKWTVTYDKFNIVNSAMSRLGNDVKSYIDIGSNLGLYVFLARIKYGLVSVGVDYNYEYIDVCEKINDKFGFGCDFNVNSFKELDIRYDCVSLLGTIHHLYHRTERFGELGPIVKKIADITKRYLIIEFPTIKDSKAKKWVNMKHRVKKEEYNLNNFMKYCEEYFINIEKLGGVIPQRPIFLMERKPNG